MSTVLPRLRLDLDFIPSPIEDRPGLLIRDSRGYSEYVIVIPPELVPLLEFFDGENTAAELREMLVKATGRLDVSDIVDNLLNSLSQAGMLHDDVFEGMREEKQRAFRESPVREPSHAGSAYPATTNELHDTIRGYLNGSTSNASDLIAIAAPHVSPFGGIESYRAAYGMLNDSYRDRTFIVLGTSHFGEPDRFGLTRKPYRTPFGDTRVDDTIVDRLAKQPAAIVEDYCHKTEHSIEFQVVFLQHLFGPNIKVVPVLCGSFARSLYEGGMPEDNEQVRSFLGELGEVAALKGKDALWVLGIDLAHIGPRYGDPAPVRAHEGDMLEVGAIDKERLTHVNSGDSKAFWNMLQEGADPLKWCGSAPLYTFMKAVPQARGTLEHYQHWNIDDSSVVSFGALGFRDAK